MLSIFNAALVCFIAPNFIQLMQLGTKNVKILYCTSVLNRGPPPKCITGACRVPTFNSGLLLPVLPLHGCCSYLSKLRAWSSSQFRVTLPSHAWVESNLLWWKDKETLIEISPSGHLVLSFHMGLDKLFSSRLAVHAVFDPSFTTMNETKNKLGSFEIPVTPVTQQKKEWRKYFLVQFPKCLQIKISFSINPHCFLWVWRFASLPPAPPWNLAVSICLILHCPESFSTSLHHLLVPETLKACVLENQHPPFLAVMQCPILCFQTVHQESLSNMMLWQYTGASREQRSDQNVSTAVGCISMTFIVHRLWIPTVLTTPRVFTAP